MAAKIRKDSVVAKEYLSTLLTVSARRLCSLKFHTALRAEYDALSVEDEGRLIILAETLLGFAGRQPYSD